MKNFKRTKKSKAFTLVELLIVLIIIGILAGMMMLNSMSATAKAEAVKIVSDMRNIKSASLLYYADNMEWPTQANIKSLDTYLDQTLEGKAYSFDETNGLYIKATVSDDQVQSKLAGMAKESGLTGSAAEYSESTKYKTGTDVFMVIRRQ